MKQTRKYTVWLNRGLDLTSVPGTQNPSSLKICKGVSLSTRPSLKKRPGLIRIPSVGNNDGVQNAIQFIANYGGSKISEFFRVRNGRYEALRDVDGADLEWVEIKLQASNGTLSDISVNPTDKVTFEQMNNILIISVENSPPVYYTIKGYLKYLQIRATHQLLPPTFFKKMDYRLCYGGIENDRDRLFISSTANIEDYTLLGGGFGIRFDDGDGDPIGLTGMSEKFRGRNYVTKWSHIYELYRGDYGYAINAVTDEVGALSQTCICTTERDIYVVDTTGIHSIMSISQAGAAEEATLTYPIYDHFQEDVNWSAYKNFHLTYEKQTSTLWFVYTSAGSSTNDKILGINIRTREVFELENSPYTAIGRCFYYNRARTFVHDEINGLNLLDKDTTTIGSSAINVDIATGVIFPTNNPKDQVNLTEAWLLCKPTNKDTTITIEYSLDGKSPQTRTVNSYGSGYGAIISSEEIGGIIGTDYIGRMPSDMAALPFKFEGECAGVEFRIRQEPPENDIDQDFEAYAIVFSYDYEEDSSQIKTI